MRFCLLFLFLLSGSYMFAASLEDIRKLYDKAIYSEKAAELLLQQTVNSESEKSTLSGYKAATRMVMAKFYFNPWKKLHAFNEGKEQLEYAIQKDPENVELVFLRFMIQMNSPSFLHYNINVASDKKMLLLSLSNIKDQDLKTRISNYLKAVDKSR